MTSKYITDKLEMLITLIMDTTEDVKEEKDSLYKTLFDEQLVQAHDLHQQITDGFDDMDAGNVRDIMLEANSLWRIRKNIKNGNHEDVEAATLQEEVERLIKKKQKINAIKHYRAHFDKMDPKPGLKESKIYVDAIQADMIRRGVIKE